MEKKEIKVDAELVCEIAELACLELREQEIEELTPQLEEFLHRVEDLVVDRKHKIAAKPTNIVFLPHDLHDYIDISPEQQVKFNTDVIEVAPKAQEGQFYSPPILKPSIDGASKDAE